MDNILKSMADALIVTDSDGLIQRVNQTTLELLAYKEEELLGNPIEMIFAENSLKKSVLEEITVKDFICNIEKTYLSKSGRKIPVLFSASTMRDVYGRKEGNVYIALDITERKQSEESLRRAHRNLAIKKAHLEEANAELSQYSYVVSHDLKAPLRAIHNYADFLREDLEETLEGEQKAYLDGLSNAVQQGEQLIEDLLELSRIGKEQGLIETVDMGKFLRQLIASLNISTDVEVIMGNNWPVIEVEPVLIRQIFQNLISNAIKFNRSPQKRIELGCLSAGEDDHELFVRDNGIGIETHHQEQIFRVFQRLHTREIFEGTGIGLAIVKKASTKLNGSVRVESKPGEGSTFFVTFPRSQKER